MFNIITSLTGNNLNQGIQDFQIFYDTLFLNFKVKDNNFSNYYDFILIEKLTFDYNNISFSSDNKNYLIDFGDTSSSLPKVSINGNIFIDNILLEKEKIIFICGLSSSGLLFCPVVFEYNINQNNLLKIYPNIDDLNIWNNYSFGRYLSSQHPLVSYNNDTKILNFIFKTTNNIIENINDIELKFTNNSLQLNSINILSGSGVSNYNSFNFVKFKNYDDNIKLVLAKTDTNTIVPFSISK